VAKLEFLLHIGKLGKHQNFAVGGLLRFLKAGKRARNPPFIKKPPVVFIPVCRQALAAGVYIVDEAGQLNEKASQIRRSRWLRRDLRRI
jgi:hypothetical protein